MGVLTTLKRFKDEVNEVVAGQECGMSFGQFQDIKQGDVVEAFELKEIPHGANSYGWGPTIVATVVTAGNLFFCSAVGYALARLVRRLQDA